MNTIQQNFDFFVKAHFPTAPKIVTDEAKLAYYAGAEAVLRIMFDIGSDDVSEDGGIAMLQGMHSECRVFAREYAERIGLPSQMVDGVAPAEERKHSA